MRHSIERVMNNSLFFFQSAVTSLLLKVIFYLIYLRDIILFQDEVIHIHRHWEADCFRKIYPQNLHMQFHGREMHSLCFITEELQPGVDGKHSIFSGFSWIATGCEDGTVRLTRYDYYQFPKSDLNMNQLFCFSV